MEKLLGDSSRQEAARVRRQTFDKWLARRSAGRAANPAAKVVLFPTCFINYYNTAPGKAAVKVFAKNSCEMACPKQNCCGMPALDGGDVEFAQKQARANVDSMLPLVRQGFKSRRSIRPAR